MGGLIVVTGAAGFLGRATVNAALARGHRVRAVMRRVAAMPEGVEVFQANLAQDDVARACAGADAIIHAAAAMTDAADTSAATQNILAAAGNACFVLVSSMAVYAAGAPGELIDEQSRLEPAPHLRDAYCRMKLAQEAAVREVLQNAWIMRPGVIVGPGRLWNDHLGIKAGPVFFQIGGDGELPLIAVDDCAKALVIAAETPPQGIEVVNVVADDLPHRHDFLMQLRDRPKAILPLPWQMLNGIGVVASPVAGYLPGLLRRPVIRARLMPQRYANRLLHERLGWQQSTPILQAIREAQAAP
jgi:nucleoside-diphosphate-sugar epimerase